jgi:hypothetical protein
LQAERKDWPEPIATFGLPRGVTPISRKAAFGYGTDQLGNAGSRDSVAGKISMFWVHGV